MPPIREHTILYTFLGEEDDVDGHEGKREEDADDDEEEGALHCLVSVLPQGAYLCFPCLFCSCFPIIPQRTFKTRALCALHATEDTDMPPLVDAPGTYTNQDGYTDQHEAAPPLSAKQTQESMMSSFDFTGVSFSGAPFAPTLIYAPQDTSNPIAEDGTPAQARGGRGRGKRAPPAPSYIPRPPNAFILFRSSFIRSQNVPGRVEGNHSTLSKIIGEWCCVFFRVLCVFFVFVFVFVLFFFFGLRLGGGELFS
jgi:hypothetical protein